ncbi:MAG: membrane-associated protease 1 [Eubacteriales bacterium]
MSISVTIKGCDTIELSTECTRRVTYSTYPSLDDQAQPNDMCSTLTIVGSILSKEEDATHSLNDWALTSAEEIDCYRQVNVTLTSGDRIVRNYFFPNAFVISQMEDYGDGDATFILVIKQKNDSIADIAIKGNTNEKRNI